MNTEEGVFDKFGLGPLTGLLAVMRLDMAIDLADFEANIAPINGVDGRWREGGSHFCSCEMRSGDFVA